MYNIEEILCEIEASTNRLKLYYQENRLADMPYELGRIAAFDIIIQETVASKICESTESSNRS